MTRVVCNDDLRGATVLTEGKSHDLELPDRLRFADQSLAVSARTQTTTGGVRQSKRAHTRVMFLHVSPLVRNMLRLPAQGTFNLMVHGAEWTLGPCLGVYTSPAAAHGRLFGEQTALFRDMVVLGQDRGVDVVILTPGFWQSQMGLRYDRSSGTWVQQEVPVPDIVLRRSGTFRKPWTDVNEELERFARTGKLHTLPRSISNKWLFYRQFKTVPSLKEHLPASHLAKSGADVWKLFASYGDVYVKPVAGAQGVSIYRLQMQNGSPVVLWEERESPGQQHKKRTVLSTRVRARALSGETDFLKFWRRTRLRACIVQETVDLPRTNDHRPFDFRWLIQYTNEPRVVARVARVGKPQSVTTNIHTGGQAVDAGQVLHFIGQASPEQLTSSLDNIALTVADTLRKKHGPFAELGVDLAIRPDGRVMVFEVNPTPGRRMLRSLPGQVREMSLEYLFEYVIRATGFQPCAGSEGGISGGGRPRGPNFHLS